MENQTLSVDADEQLIEVFDGVVSPRQLFWSSLATCTAGLVVFNIALHSFRVIAEPKIASGYALLAGLVACVLCAAVTTRYVKPKRTVTQDAFDPDTLAETMDEVMFVAGGDPDPATAPAAANAEMKRTGLDELFAEYTRTSAAAER